MQKRIIINILYILMEDLKKLENLILQELGKAKNSQNIQEERNKANMILYEMGVCIMAMRDIRYEINPKEVPVERAGTFLRIIERIRLMKQKVCNLQSDCENVKDFEELYGAFVSIFAFIESMERSKKTPYPLLDKKQKTKVDNDFILLKTYAAECR